jgi:hypothetical protein
MATDIFSNTQELLRLRSPAGSTGKKPSRRSRLGFAGLVFARFVCWEMEWCIPLRPPRCARRLFGRGRAGPQDAPRDKQLTTPEARPAEGTTARSARRKKCLWIRQQTRPAPPGAARAHRTSAEGAKGTTACRVHSSTHRSHSYVMGFHVFVASERRLCSDSSEDSSHRCIEVCPNSASRPARWGPPDVE